MFGFSDETYIDVASGNGGNGCVSFRRELCVPKGGPDGGDGGRGGDVVFVVKPNLRTLDRLKMRRSYKAENGQNGGGARCFGRDGRDVIVEVPAGTVIKNAQTGEIIQDLTGMDRFVFLKGGKGGLGNWHFRSATRQTPRFAQKGQEGQSMRVGVELLLIADIGFVGYPNAGKSSLLNALTNARAKVAGYPFTTKIPQLGMMRYGDQDVVLADIPGLIDGASQGAGMGIKFLRHIARTKGLAFLIDVTDDRYLNAYDALCGELKAFNPEMMDKPSVIVATHMDGEHAEEHLAQLKKKYPDKEIVPICVFLDQGIEEVKQSFMRLANRGNEGVAQTGGFSSHPDLDAEYVMPEEQKQPEEE